MDFRHRRIHRKSFGDITVEDLMKQPLWRFTNGDVDELEIEPVLERPCRAKAVIIGTRVRLADGTEVWAILQNVESARPDLNEHFLTLTIANQGAWFPLARYHDVAEDAWGPGALASFLGKSLDQVFPITFDVRAELGCDDRGLVGTVRQEPTIRLTLKQIVALSLSKH